MSAQIVIPDQIHIDRIRERLWCDQEFGRAAVMVGTGFSRNAEKVSPNVPDFPLWADLAGIMFDGLYRQDDPNIRNRSERRIKETYGLNAVRLASQYEAAFSAHALDSLIRQNLPDQQHRPGWLHRCLLELPWSDVFTTNYDTLLERTLPLVHERKYDIVLDHSDIPHAMRPRLVKLHGCLYSKRPLIITEEHYRTYPHEFAPFVNMVQQAIMENLLCLVGFSGEDPNFLYWSGWVRDNLGQHAPPIYLVQSKRVTVAEDRLLRNRNVIPIDLSPVVSDANVNPVDQHRLCLSWFVENLLQGAPPNGLRWPDQPVQTSCISSRILSGLPPVPKSPKYKESPALDVWPPGSVKREDLLKALEIWKTERKQYPNWIVCPRSSRDRIWRETEHRILGILRNLDVLSLPEQLEIFYELNWRLEIALMPLFGMEKDIAKLLEQINPYPEQCQLPDAVLTPNLEEHKNLDWTRLGIRWVYLTFALARTAREDLDRSKFRYWMDRIETISEQRIQWKARWYFEECLFALCSLDQNAASKTVSKWPDTKELPLWEGRRAAILAEIGELSEAERIAEDVLADVRRRQTLFRGDLFLFSLEGWLMLLLNAIKGNNFFLGREFRAKYWDRWETLSIYKCNPWADLEWVQMALNAEPSSQKEGKEVKLGFDPGRKTINYQLASSDDMTQYGQAFGFLRMLEEGCLPPAVGTVSTIGKSITRPAMLTEYFSIPRSVSIIVRSRSQEDLGKWLDRVRVAVLDETDIKIVVSMLMTSFQQELINLGTRNLTRIIVIAEAISRVCFRFPNDILINFFNLAIQFYNHPVARMNFSLHESVRIIFERLLYAMRQSDVLYRLPILLSLPIAGDGHFDVQETQTWVEPLSCIHWPQKAELPAEFDRSPWDVHIANLLAKAKHVNPEVRKRAILRIEKILEIGALTQAEANEFGATLWSQLDSESHLPTHTGLYGFAFLTLPEQTPGQAKHKLHDHILARDFPRVFQRQVTPGGQASVSVAGIDVTFENFLSNLLGSTVPLFPADEKEREYFIDWTQEEAISLLEKAVLWWNEEKGQLDGTPRSSFWDVKDILRQRLSKLIPVLREIILPRLANSEEKIKAQASNLLSEMDRADFCILSALPMTLFLDPSGAEEVVRRMRQELLSRRHERVSGAIVGILHWAARSNTGSIPAPATDLWKELEYKLIARKQPALGTAISVMSAIVKHLPQVLDDGNIEIERLFEALKYLLEDTRLPDESTNVRREDHNLLVTLEEIPEYRRLAAEMAYVIFEYLQKKGLDIPEVITQWQVMAQVDPLPEVRRAWPSLG